ncbi:MAG: LysR family transcriptional regulator [Acidimicrobiales bacterium]
MAEAEWLMTFVAVYRSGSVTDGAHCRGITQPAASQQLASLEHRVGEPVFVRRPSGVEPTQRGRELYAEAADSLDRLESVLRLVGAGPGSRPEPPVRFGSSPEYFAAELLPRLAGLDVSVSASFGSDPELFNLLDIGELDVVVASSTPPRRSATGTQVGAKRFVLVAAPALAPTTPLGSVAELTGWLRERPWASYSGELPLTRRFWLDALGSPFAARLKVVAPDLRAVLRAVELGLGVSLLPAFVCIDALAQASVVELFPVAQLVPEEPWFACTRHGSTARANVRKVLDALRASAPK